MKIDFDGIQDRVVALAVDPAVIRSFAAGKGFLYYSTVPIQGLSGPIAGEDSAVRAYDLKERKESTLIENVQRFALSFDGSKLLYEGEGGSRRSHLRNHRRQACRWAEESGRRRAELGRNAGRDRSAAGMEECVQRSLAAGARLLL